MPYKKEHTFEKIPNELFDFIDLLLSGQETNISNILSLPYFNNIITLKGGRYAIPYIY